MRRLQRTAISVVLLLLSAVPAFAITRQWNGSQSPNWSNPLNWTPQGLPQPEDRLEFPGTARNLVMNNDLPAYTAVGQLSFTAEAVLNGNPLTLTGDLGYVSSPSAVSSTVNVDVRLANSITFRSAYGKGFNGAIDVNGKTLTIDPAYNTHLNGPLRGDGVIHVIGTGLNISGSGTFSGVVDGRVNIVGNYPNLRIRSPRASGNATTGALHAGLLYPGDAPPLPSGGEQVLGVLNTGSLTIDPAGARENGGAYNSMPRGRLLVDVLANGGSDQIKVRGTVTLEATLDISLRGTPTAGQTWLLIENDGTDAVLGRFTDLSEGGMFAVGGTNFWITYRGGDGNDVVLNAGTPPVTAKTWTGATSANWSEPTNWSPTGVPVNGDALYFPAGARLTTTNDLANFIAGPMTFSDDYVLSGNAITIRGDLLFSNTADFVCNAPIIVGTALRIHDGASTQFNGAVDFGRHLVTIETRRTVIRGPISGVTEVLIEGEGLAVAGDGPFSGRFRGKLDLVGTYPNTTMDGWLGDLSGSGAVQAIAAMTISPGSTMPWASDSRQRGVLRTSFLSINENYIVDVSPNGGSDQIIAYGHVALYGKLTVNVTAPLSANQSFTIIELEGDIKPYEHFRGLPEGSTWYVGEAKFRITYAGGNGNDVVITHLGAPKAATSTSLAQSRATTEVNQPVTFTATVTSNAGTPTGSVTFTAGSQVLGTVVLTNGVAELTTKNLSRGTHTIVATYSGSDTHDASASAPVTHTVVRGKPNVAMTSLSASLVHGDAASFRVDVTSADTRVPTGNVTLRVDGNAAGSGALANGSVTLNVASLAAGSHTITAAYEGNDEFDAGTATLTQNVAKVKTALSIESDANPAKAGATVNLTIRASSLDRPALAINGPLVIRSNGQVVSEVALTGNIAAAKIGPLAAGDYELTATFLGGEAFDASGATLLQRIVADQQPGKTATATTLAQDRAISEVNQPVIFTAKVTALGATPEGNVTFSAAGTTLGSAPLVSGLAELRVKTLPLGAHTITAAYAGNDTFDASTAAPLVHTVVRGNPHMAVTAAASSIVHGESVAIRIELSSRGNDDRVPTGRVTLRAGATVAGSGTLANGVATINVPVLPAGAQLLTAEYEGDAEFARANASLTINVAKAKPFVTIDPGANPAFAGVPVDLTVRVNPGLASLRIDGNAIVRIDGDVIGDVPIAGNLGILRVGPFEPGQYEITAGYAGSANFESAGAKLTLNVTAPMVSIASHNFDEGNGMHEVEVQIELTGSSTRPIVLDYRTVDGTALAAADYDGARGTVVFAPGQTVARVPIRIRGDVEPEPDETFALELTNAVGARFTAPSASVVIQNDEPLYAAGAAYTYATVDGVELQATHYAPLGWDGPRPVILWVPGDEAYDAKGGPIAALRLTARGYAVVSASYRSAGTAPFPAQLEDLGKAVQWLRANATQLGIDPNRITAWGTGAGGHLAALLGTGMGDRAADTRVQAVVVWNGIADPSTLSDDAPQCSTIDWNAATSPAAKLLGCSPELCSASAEAAAPARYAGADDAPVLLMHAKSNCFVGANQSQRLYDALRAAGVDATLRMIDDESFFGAGAFGEVQTFLESKLKPGRRRAAGR